MCELRIVVITACIDKIRDRGGMNNVRNDLSYEPKDHMSGAK